MERALPQSALCSILLGFRAVQYVFFAIITHDVENDGRSLSTFHTVFNSYCHIDLVVVAIKYILDNDSIVLPQSEWNTEYTIEQGCTILEYKFGKNS